MSRYRTFWRRLFAGVADSLIFYPLLVVDGWVWSAEPSPVALLAWSAIAFFALTFYSVLMHSQDGQTLGKMIFGVKVLDVSESRLPTLRQAAMRDVGIIALNVGGYLYLVYVVLAQDPSSLPDQLLSWAEFAWFMLEVVTMLWNIQRRAFHDLLANTVVVRVIR